MCVVEQRVFRHDVDKRVPGKQMYDTLECWTRTAIAAGRWDCGTVGVRTGERLPCVRTSYADVHARGVRKCVSFRIF